MSYKYLACISILVSMPGFLAGQKLKLETLPRPLQESVRQQIKSLTLVAITKEREGGKTIYEIETKDGNGLTRDFLVNTDGTLIESEEQVELDSLPLPARTAIQKRSAGGQIKKVEKLTKGSSISYEAAVRAKTGKTSEIAVNADGSTHKD